MAECKNDHVLLRSYNELQHSKDVSQTSERQDLGTNVPSTKVRRAASPLSKVQDPTQLT